MKILPTDPRIRYVGRFVHEVGRTILGWPGTGFDILFEGSTLILDLSGTRAWVDVFLDDSEAVVVDSQAVGGTIRYEGLGLGVHRLRLRKRTEALVGSLAVKGAQTDGHFLPPSDPPGLRLEFYGDSITCGYGCLDPVPEHGFSAATETFALSWAGRTGAILGAEVHAQAISGIGVARNWPGVAGTPLPSRWKLAHPDREVRWDLSSWIPHAVVVNLGSNDFGTLPFMPETEFVQAFRNWLTELRDARPGVPLVVVDGPLLSDDHPAVGTRVLVRSLLDQIAAKTGAVRFSLTPCDPSDGFAADFHPSAIQHERNAAEFAPFLSSLLGVVPETRGTVS